MNKMSSSFKCPICFQLFDSKDDLTAHMLSVHGANPTNVLQGKESVLLEPYRDWLGTDYTKFWERLTDRDQVVKWENFFQSEDHVAFSPATSRHGIETLGLLALAARFSKTPDDRKMLKEIIIKYLDSCARIIESVQDASHSNWLTALNNQHIAAAISHRIGLIDDGGYLKILDHYRNVFDRVANIEILSTTLGGVTTLVQGSKISSGEAGMSGQGLGSLAVMLKALTAGA